MKRFPSIKKNEQFRHIYHKGKSCANRQFVLYVLKTVQEPENPEKTGQKPENPAKTGQKPENPEKTGQKPENPAKTGQKPEHPAKTGQKPENPEKTGQKPENPSIEARTSRPGKGSQGGDLPGETARGPERYRLRIGISVSKKIGNSVVRHRITRQVREIFRLNIHRLSGGHDLVLVARKGAKGEPYGVLEQSFLHLCRLQKILRA
ncbi:MAG: ribonuclease P protein component [Lachnospiraceae bacterium]|jgi:ribonuclease P protein component|nr:ribonuclease P protein component [Lachnospiraceae bacterium]